MKIIINNSVVKETENSVNNIIKTYKEDIPVYKEVMPKNNVSIKLCDTDRKWGSISHDDENIIFDIKDSFIIDMIYIIGKVVCKFTPIISTAFSMIPLFKNYLKNVQEIAEPIYEKYKDEFEYAISKVEFPGVKIGYVILYRVKGETKWSDYCESVIHFTDEFNKMNETVRSEMVKNISEMSVETFNDEGVEIFNNQKDAKSVIDVQIEHYNRSL